MPSKSEDDVSDRDELERLRSLVGASEVSYDASLRDRAEAERVAREALGEVGELRGEIVELGVEVARAHQAHQVMLGERNEALRVAQEAAAETQEVLAENGLLRREVEGLGTQLAGALHDREVLLQRAAMRPGRRLYDQVRGRWRTTVAPRLKRLTGRSR